MISCVSGLTLPYGLYDESLNLKVQNLKLFLIKDQS